VFLNAGIARFAPLEQATEDSFDQSFAVNVRGPLLQTRALLPLLGDGSSVVINASVGRSLGFPNTSIYSATKGAVRSMVRVLARELSVLQIRVNTVSPGRSRPRSSPPSACQPRPSRNSKSGRWPTYRSVESAARRRPPRWPCSCSPMRRRQSSRSLRDARVDLLGDSLLFAHGALLNAYRRHPACLDKAAHSRRPELVVHPS
jgi:NAD(P)-dependent dehydrogenase (short-subunit alcohol dehydrogenase family)